MARKADPTTRGKLLDAARHEFSVHGLDGALVSNITARAGVSKGAFYLHFESKEHAFEVVANDFLGVFVRMLEGLDQLHRSESEVATLMEESLERDISLMEFLWQERAFALVVFEGARSARHCHLIEAFASQVEERVAQLIKVDLDMGRARPDVNVRLLAAFIAGGFDRYARVLLASEVKPNIREDLRNLHAFISLGLLTMESREQASPSVLLPRKAS